MKPRRKDNNQRSTNKRTNNQKSKNQTTTSKKSTNKKTNKQESNETTTTDVQRQLELHDVLISSTPAMRDWPGNVRFREMVSLFHHALTGTTLLTEGTENDLTTDQLARKFVDALTSENRTFWRAKTVTTESSSYRRIIKVGNEEAVMVSKRALLKQPIHGGDALMAEAAAPSPPAVEPLGLELLPAEEAPARLPSPLPPPARLPPAAPAARLPTPPPPAARLLAAQSPAQTSAARLEDWCVRPTTSAHPILFRGININSSAEMSMTPPHHHRVHLKQAPAGHGKQPEVVVRKQQKSVKHVIEKPVAAAASAPAQWCFRGGNWDAMFERLWLFHLEHGTTSVPRLYVDDQGNRLGDWVAKQRTYIPHLQNLLERNRRIKLLNSLSFDWNSDYSEWDRNYERLCCFQELYGHTCVPKTFVDETGFHLGVWMSRQQDSLNQLEDSVERLRRIEKLNRIRFCVGR